MKKKLSIIFLALALCVTAVFVTACGGKKTGEKSDYEWKYEKEFTDEHDADMTIDGALNEQRWQGQQYLTHVQDGVTVNYTAVFTEKGLYVGAKAQDPDMKWNARFNFSSTNANPANSAFWFNIKGPDVQDGHAMRAFNFFIDAFDSASRNQTRFEAKSKVNGDIMKFEATEMTAELFVSWDALNIDTTDGLPEFVRIIPYYRHVKAVGDAGENKWLTPIFIYGNPGWDYGLSYDENLHQNWYRPISGMKFGSVGYINADKPGAVVGDAANGYSKSSGWDLSRIDEGAVKAVGPDEQAIFFKGIDSSKYMVSAKMKMLGGAMHAGNWKDQYPSAGIINMRDETESIALYISGRSILDGAASWNFHTLDKYTGWKDTYEGSFTKPDGFNPQTDSIELKCIQYDENLFYFINGELALIKRVDWIKDGACPGLYGLSAEVEFTDFKATDYKDDADALKAIISEYAYSVSVTAGDGGFVTIDKTALRKGDSLTVNVAPSAGYVLSSFEINGKDKKEDKYDYVVENLDNGKVVFDDITEDSSIVASFARLDGGVRVSGKISAGGRAMTTSALTLTAPSDKRVFYTATPTSNGSFNFTLSPAGTYAVGAKTITLDGNYVLKIKTPGYRDKTIEITVNADDKSVRVPDVELEKNVVGGSVTIGGRAFDSSVNTWDMRAEADSAVYAENGSNGSLAYFTDKTGKDAVVDFTISNKTEIIEGGKYEAEPCMGVSLTDGSNRFDIFVFNEGLRISPKGWWNGGGEAYNVSVPVNYSLRAKENPEKLTFRLVRSGAAVALLYKAGDDYTEIWRTRNATIEKMSAYAFTVCQSQPCRLEFSNYSIKLDDEAKDYIEAVLYETVTLGAYDTAGGTVTITGTGADGKIKYGDKLTVAIDSQKTAIVTYGDKTEIVTGGGEVSFTATHSGEVSVSFADSLIAVNGTVALGDALSGITADYTKTTLTFEGEGYTLAYDGIVKADGTFTLDLPSGEYRVSAVNPAAYAKSVSVTIDGENNAVAVKLTLSAVTSGNTTYTVSSDGTLTGHTDGAGKSEFYNFGSAESFTVETTVAACDLSVETYPQAGLGLVTGGGNYLWVLFHEGNTGKWKILFVRHNGYSVQYYDEVDPTDGVTLKADYNGSVLKLYINGALKATYSQGDAFIKDNTFGGAITAGLVNVGTAGVFTDYTFVPRGRRAASLEGTVTSVVSGAEAAGARVKIVNADGTLEYNCFAGEDGKFAFGIADGEYKIYAAVNGKAASLAYAVKIAGDTITEINGVSTTALNVVIDKPVAGGALSYNPVSGTISGNEQRNGYLFGAEVDYGEPYVLTATVKRQEVMWWPAIGLLIGHGGDNYMQFAIRKCCPDSGVYYDFFLRRAANGEAVPQLYKDYKFGEALTADAFGADDTVKLTIAYYGGNYYIYMDDALTFTISETTVLDGVALKDAIGTGRIKLGLFSEQEGTFTDWGYEVGKTAAAKLLTRTITLPEDVTAKIGETEVTDGKALMGDTVTVSMTSENRVTFSVDGAPVATETDGNVYTASFVVTGNHAVTYEYSYAVSGKIAKPDYATADLTSTVLKFTSGETAEFGGAVNANGEYTVYLPAGEYSMRAEHPGFMPASGGAVTVTSAAVENANAAFTLVRPENMNGLTYDESTGKLSNKGDIVTCFGSGSDFVVTTYVDKITTEWKAAGLVLIDASTNKFVKIAIRKTASGFDLFSHLGDGYMDFPAIADPFTQNGERAKLTVVRRSASLAVFINDEFVAAIGISASTAVHHWGTPDTVLTDYLTPGGEYSFGLGTCDNTNATFSEWSYGLTFSDLYAVGGKTLTLPEGVTAKVGETEITDGKAILGDTVTVSMTSENRVTFSVDGAPVTTDNDGNVYSASFTVTGNHTVTYEVAYAVSGKITKPDYATADITSTLLKFIKNGAATEFTDAVGENGEYSVYLPAGEYTVRAEHAGFMPVVGDTIAVTNAAVENVGVAFTLVKPENMNGLTYDEGTGKLSNSGDIVTYFGSGNDFAATTYIDKITTDWKAAGIVVGDATKKNFVKFTIRKRADGNCDLFINVGDGYMEMPVIGNPFMQSGERAKLTVERIGATIKVYVNDELKSTIAVADTTVVKHWGSADTKITDYLSADGEYRFGFGTCDGTNAIFSEWSYKLK